MTGNEHKGAETALVYKMWGQIHDQRPPGDPKDTLRELVAALATKDAGLSALREALQLAVSHVEHMAAWIGSTNSGEAKGLYSFEALGEDMPGIKAALTHQEKDAQDG